MERKREAWLDLLRLTAMIAVMLLHAMSDVVNDLFYYGKSSWYICMALVPLCRAGVPLFFMISGHLLLGDSRSREVLPFYKKRLPRLLIPLLVWNLIYSLAAPGQESWSLSGLLDAVLELGVSYHMWFVYTLAGIYLLTPFLRRMVEGCSRRELWIFLAIAAFAGTIRPFLNLHTPLYIHLFDPLLNGYIAYFFLGYLLGTAQPRPWQRNLAYLGGLAGAALCIGGNLAASSESGLSFPYNGGYMLNHFLVASALFLLARRLEEKLPARTLLARLSDVTFGAYFVHVLAIELWDRFLAPDLSPMGLVALRFLFTVAASYFFAWAVSLLRPLKKLLM